MNIKEIEQKFYSGDSISDEELLYILNHFDTLVRMLDELGERWAHSRNEARRLFDAFESYRLARMINKETNSYQLGPFKNTEETGFHPADEE